MNKMVLFFGAALALFVAMGATSHMRKELSKDKSAPLLMPLKCQETIPCSGDKTRTSEIFLRKVTRYARRFYA